MTQPYYRNAVNSLARLVMSSPSYKKAISLLIDDCEGPVEYLTPSKLANWSPVVRSTISASSPTHVARMRPLASSDVLPPV